MAAGLSFALWVMAAARASREHSKKSTLSGRIRLREKCLQPRFVLSLDQHPELFKREHRILARNADVRVALPMIVERELQSVIDAMSDTGDCCAYLASRYLIARFYKAPRAIHLDMHRGKNPGLTLIV